MTIFKLPDLGEGLPDAEISEWHVKEGEEISLDQSLVSMETAKAVVEVPSPFAGRIKKLYGQKGDIIKTGAPLVEYEKEAVEHVNESGSSADAEAAATVAGKLEVGTTILRESPTGITKSSSGFSPQSTFGSSSTSSVVKTGSSSATIKATPATRALAQHLKVDLTTVTATGPKGTITTQDVERAAQNKSSEVFAGDQSAVKAGGSGSSIGTTDRVSSGIVQIPGMGPLEPLKGVRRVMAQAMVQSHREVVPVTVMDDAKLVGWNGKQDITVRLIQAICKACKQEPALNAWFDGKEMGRYLNSHINLGIAADTVDGLFVPVIHQAEMLDSAALRQKIDALKKQVAERSIKPEDLRGATFILSNFGKFAGRYANPIIVPPMVAILGVGSMREEVVAVEGKPMVCPVLPLALTFDHRAVTGGEATRFLGIVIESLQKPD